jgi:signal transduction histidine kinase
MVVGSSKIVHLALPLLVFSQAVVAVIPNPRTVPLYHRSWTSKDGAPQNIQSITQTPDGFLWLATFSGLYRFDGIHFEAYQPASGRLLKQNLSSIFAVPDGGLWVAYSYGGVSFIRDGAITHYDEKDGLPAHTIRDFFRDADGTMWAVGDTSLLRFEPPVWKNIGADWNFSADRVLDHLVDHKGTVWISVEGKILFLPRGEKTFQLAVPARAGRIALAKDGTVWMCSNSRCLSVDSTGKAEQEGRQFRLPFKAEVTAISGDDLNWLWFFTKADGVYRIHPLDADAAETAQSLDLQHFTQEDGLTGDRFQIRLSDREGNFWLGSNLGLDQFRPSAFGSMTPARGVSAISLTKAADGGIWMASYFGRVLMHIKAGKIVSQRPLPGVVSAYTDSSGDVWMGTRERRQILHLSGNKLQTLDIPAAAVAGITKDAAGRIWALFSGKGYFRYENGQWVSLASMGAPEHGAIGAYTDSAGRVWFGYSHNRVALLDGDRLTMLSGQDGVRVGDVTTIAGGNGSLWIGGDEGLQRFDGHRFVTISPAEGPEFSGISAIVLTENDGTWIGENRGVVQIPPSELKAFEREPHHRVGFRVFDSLDGLSVSLQPAFPAPSAVQEKDGIIWFATANGLVWIDPRNIPENRVAPPVAVQSVFANGARVSLYRVNSLELPARTGSLQISYTAPSLSIPERVRFRYLLEGQDQNWQEAGTRREAFYTNLDPGNYKFHVIACNSDGVCNQGGLALQFSIAPAWFQTGWFRAFYLLGGLATVWLVFRLRMRQVARALTARFDERLSERTRLARELHDTLLQTIQGSKMVADDALDGASDPTRMRRAMEQLSVWLGRATLEGRAALNSLRASSAETNNLAEAFRRAMENDTPRESMTASLEVVGKPREMHPIIRDEVYRIGYEAIRNALAHSRGSRLEVDLRYGKALVVRISDNGVGIDPVIAQHGREDHFGLHGMRERAARIGATLKVVSSQACGTTITLTVPGTIIFQKPSGTMVEKFRNAIRRIAKLPHFE